MMGCSSGRAQSQPCPRAVAAFRLELTAVDGELPSNTVLEVRYGGQQSGSYSLSRPTLTNEDVCCRSAEVTRPPLPEVRCGAPPLDGSTAHTRAILCELWTNGLAELKVTAQGYPRLDRVLQSRLASERCGVETVDVEVQLTHGDGGSLAP
jgi:hypothetical protein